MPKRTTHPGVTLSQASVVIAERHYLQQISKPAASTLEGALGIEEPLERVIAAV